MKRKKSNYPFRQVRMVGMMIFVVTALVGVVFLVHVLIALCRESGTHVSNRAKGRKTSTVVVQLPPRSFFTQQRSFTGATQALLVREPGDLKTGDDRVHQTAIPAVSLEEFGASPRRLALRPR